MIYTSEDLKWDSPLGRISNQHWILTLAEIKCDILFLQGFNITPIFILLIIFSLHFYKLSKNVCKSVSSCNFSNK